MSDGTDEGKWDISYFVVNMVNLDEREIEQKIRQIIRRGKKKFDEQCECKDFIKYLCTIFEKKGLFRETKEEPLGTDKIFWGIDKWKIVNALVGRFAPASIVNPRQVRRAAHNGFLVD